GRASSPTSCSLVCVVSCSSRSASGAHRDPPSFPTRRSSDLDDGSHFAGVRSRLAEVRARLIRAGLAWLAAAAGVYAAAPRLIEQDRKSTRLNSSHVKISYAVFCWKKKNWSTGPRPDVGSARR